MEQELLKTMRDIVILTRNALITAHEAYVIALEQFANAPMQFAVLEPSITQDVLEMAGLENARQARKAGGRV
jgi:hypothetical protein